MRRDSGPSAKAQEPATPPERIRQLKTSWRSPFRQFLIVTLCWVAGVSIRSALAGDDLETWKQDGARALIDVRGSGPDLQGYETWGPILQIAEFCPHHPELIETLFSVLQDETRRDDWEQAMGCVSTAVHHGFKLSLSHVHTLVAILPKLKVYDCGGCLFLLGTAQEHADIAMAAVRPYLAHDNTPLSTNAAASVLRLNPTDREAHDVLLKVAISMTIKDRRCAVFRMGRSGVDTPQFRDALRVAMKDSDSGVRVLSACSLWGITKSAEEALPVLRASLADESVQIDFSPVSFPSRTYPSQHVSIINCLGEMATTKPAAKQLVEDIAMKKIVVDDEWGAIIPSLIRANGRVKYGETSFQEAVIRTALADDGVFSEIAKNLYSKLTNDERRSRLELYPALREQEALWKELGSD